MAKTSSSGSWNLIAVLKSCSETLWSNIIDFYCLLCERLLVLVQCKLTKHCPANAIKVAYPTLRTKWSEFAPNPLHFCCIHRHFETILTSVHTSYFYMSVDQRILCLLALRISNHAVNKTKHFITSIIHKSSNHRHTPSYINPPQITPVHLNKLSPVLRFINGLLWRQFRLPEMVVSFQFPRGARFSKAAGWFVGWIGWSRSFRFMQSRTQQLPFDEQRGCVFINIHHF